MAAESSAYGVDNKGNTVDADGNIVWLFPDFLAQQIRRPSFCIICCRRYTSKNPREKEHILPDWLLGLSSTYDSEVTVPKSLTHRASTYKVPLCRDCNRRLGIKLEQPMSSAFRSGHEGIVELINQRPEIVFQWLNLIYFKTHYKDSFLVLHKGKGEKEYLDSDIEWETFFRTHAIARSVLFDIKIHKSIIGSLKVFKIKDWQKATNVEYYDNLHWSSCWIRFEESVIFCSLKDSNVGQRVLSHEIYRSNGALSYFEFLSVVAEFELCYRRMEVLRRLDISFRTDDRRLMIGNSFDGPVKIKPLSEGERKFLLDHLFSDRLKRM